METYKMKRYIFLSIIGVIVSGAGLAFLTLLPETHWLLKTLPKLPHLCILWGVYLFGYSRSEIIKPKIVLKNPQASKQREVEEKDERNQAISDKAKARAFDISAYVYLVALTVFILVPDELAGKLAVLIVTVAYFVTLGIKNHYLDKYNMEM